jgi:D-sedoheptulose 7-phosphate isomerase
MSKIETLDSEINNLINALNKLKNFQKNLEKIINVLVNCIIKKKKIFICGNGGSAAESEHLSAEFIVRLKPFNNRKPLPIFSLSQNSSVLTACGNDYGFEYTFSRTLDAIGSKGDILISLSTSGNSKNILAAINLAKKKKIKTISLLGFNGGKAKNISDLFLIVESTNVATIQECHLFLGHYVLSEVENKIFYLKKKL